MMFSDSPSMIFHVHSSAKTRHGQHDSAHQYLSDLARLFVLKPAGYQTHVLPKHSNTGPDAI